MKTLSKFRTMVTAMLMMLLSMHIINAQEIQVQGIVTDSNGEPLIGVTVQPKNNPKSGTSTDIDGHYSIKASKNESLLFSYIGYRPKTEAVNGRQEINVVMELSEESLEEVVVIGYGTMDKKELTSAISHVGSKDFLSTSGIDPVMMIQGKVPGVSITNTGAADPNNQASIQIRGVSSRSAGLGPLIVIDGVPGGNLTNINATDIESFDILKDGAASSIYGTRGSNGVILITTKKGAKDGSVHTTYEGTVSFDKMKRELDFLSADEWRQYRPDAVDLGGNEDWLDAVSRTGFSHKHTISISGGNANTNFRASVDYRNANGIDLRSNREEYGARITVGHKTKGGLFDFRLNAAPRIAYRDNSDWGCFRAAVEINPTTPIMNPENPTQYYNVNDHNAGFNPVETLKVEDSSGTTKFLEWDATAKLNILPLFAKNETSNHTLNTQITFADHQFDNFNSWFRPSTSTQAIRNGYTGEASRSYDKESIHSLEWIANYSGSFGLNNLKAMAGYSYQYFQYSGMSASNKDFPNDALGSDDLSSGSYAKEEGEVGFDSYKNSSKLIAFFGRISYDYNKKYMLTASIRHEGSSKFGANHKWGNFPSVSVGWRISQENFMKDATWINDLKIRADYGETGNQDFGSYNSLVTMQGFGYYFYNGKFFQVWGPGKNSNPDLKWEKGKNWNVGVDFQLFENRLSGSVNYYCRKQSDLLGNYAVSIPPYLHESTFVNVGTMRNSGLEINLNWNAVNTKDFSYSIDLSGATISNKFLSFSNSDYIGSNYFDQATTEDPYPYHDLQRIEEGKRIGNFRLYKYAGIDTDGAWVVYDKDGDLIKINQATNDDKQICGNGLPKFTGSMGHNFRYRNFDLSMFFRCALGFQIFNTHDFFYGVKTFTGNVTKKAYGKNDLVTANPAPTDYFLENGDYLKFDNLTLGYTINLQNSRFLDRIRVFGTCKNLVTLTKFSGVDPDCYQINGLAPSASGSRQYYPSSRQFILGVQVDF